MKWFRASGVGRIEQVCIATFALLSLYYAVTAALAPDIGPFLYSDSIGPFLYSDSIGQGSPRTRCANRANIPQDLSASLGCRLICSLPEGWGADLTDGKLWITHYSPDGTVTDSLPFDGAGDFHGWAQNHPNFCDVGVEKLEPHVRAVAVRAETTSF